MSNGTIGEITGVVEKTQGTQKYLFGTITSDKIKNVTLFQSLSLAVKPLLMRLKKMGISDLVHGPEW